MYTIGHKPTFFGKYPKQYNYSSKLYFVYNSMKDRCKNKNTKNYKNYGGRGIRVCDEWNNSYEFFLKWALSNGYREGLQLDRIDNNGNYSPENCRWVSCKQNLNNTRMNNLITYKNKTHTISEWADMFKINYMTLYRRIKDGWDIERALKTPINQKNINKRFLKEIQGNE